MLGFVEYLAWLPWSASGRLPYGWCFPLECARCPSTVVPEEHEADADNQCKQGESQPGDAPPSTGRPVPPPATLAADCALELGLETHKVVRNCIHSSSFAVIDSRRRSAREMGEGGSASGAPDEPSVHATRHTS
jgi:hypothetical protein